MVSFSSIVASLLGCVLLASSVPTTDAQSCTNVHVVFARGTNQAAGLGNEGQTLVKGLTSALTGKTISSYAVNYAASQDQSSAGPGATDMTKHIVSYAASCPNAVFVIGGYSQGASVTVIAIGIKTSLGTGQVIPTTLAPRIKAVVTFGNPLALSGTTIAQASPLYGPKSVDDCNRGDPVCGAGFNIIAHLQYVSDGSVAAAATKAANLVKATTRNLRGENDQE